MDLKLNDANRAVRAALVAHRETEGGLSLWLEWWGTFTEESKTRALEVLVQAMGDWLGHRVEYHHGEFRVVFQDTGEMLEFVLRWA